MRYVTGGGVLVFPVNPDSNGNREVIRCHSFRIREGVQYDVQAVWPLLAGVRPNDPNLAPPFAGVEPAASSAGADPSASAPADPGPEYMDVDLRGDDDDDDDDDGDDDDEMGVSLIEDHCIHYYHQSIWNDFASIDSMMEVGSSSTVFKEHFGGIDIQVEVPLEVHAELTGMLLDHAQVIEGMRTEVKQLEILKVGKNLTESSARKLAKEKGAKILTSRWVNTQKTPTLGCRLVVRDFASGAESAFRSGIYAPKSFSTLTVWTSWLKATSEKGPHLSCVVFTKNQ